MPDTDRIAALEHELAETATKLATLKAQELPSDWWSFLQLATSEQDRHRRERPDAVKALERAWYLGVAGGPR